MLKRAVFALLGMALVSGCATTPEGPRVAVMPAPGKPFDVFAQDENTCRGYASQAVAGEADRANGNGVAAALIGAALGAGIGTAVDKGHGASVGLAYGTAAGTAVGASQSNAANYSIQQRYDIAYEQCMYAKGNQVPGYTGAGYGGTPPPPPPGNGHWTPPPPNYPPPPPPPHS
jgi:uncharacterized protein YcfJ